MEKVALYLRGSTDLQEMSIPDQRKILKKYCQGKGYKVVDEFLDEGISGTTFEKRPGVMGLIHQAQSGLHKFAKVVILNESRFGRAANAKESFHHEFLLEKAGVLIEYAQSESNMPGPAGLLTRAIKYEQAGEFSKQLSRDTIRGQKTAAEMGNSTGGYPPFGFARMVYDETGKALHILNQGQRKAVKNHSVKWVPGDPRHIRIVNRIFSLYSEGQKGQKAICHTLNSENILSPKGGPWGIDTIHSILVNRAYIGERRYGGSKWSKKVSEKVVCRDAHPSIVPKVLFEKVQAVMKSRHFGKCNGMRTEYLLSGKILCLDCGYKFQGRKTKNNEGRLYYYYVDSGYQNYRACTPLSIPKYSKDGITGIEDFVIDQIGKMLDSDKYVDRFKGYLKDILIGLERESNTAYPMLQKKLKDLDREITSIQDVLIETKSKSLGERLLKKEAEREELCKELGNYEGIKKEPSKVLLLVNEYAEVLKNVGEVIRKRSPGEQKTAIGFFLDRVEVRKKEGVARCYFYDLPRPGGIDYLVPGLEKNRVCQDGAEGRNRTGTVF